jgi:hypothetical protein
VTFTWFLMNVSAMRETVRFWLIFWTVILGLAACSEPVWGPGVVVREEPLQESTGREPWEREGFTFKPRAEFQVRARILSIKWYGQSDPGTAFAPVDFALGWGPMSDDVVLDRLSIKQSGRWYHYRWEGSAPLPVQDIIRSSSNMHLAPSEPWIEDVLKEAREGDVVTLTGVLVDVDGPERRYWRTSTSRKDSGDGACEIVWVENIELEPAPRR